MVPDKPVQHFIQHHATILHPTTLYWFGHSAARCCMMLKNVENLARSLIWIKVFFMPFLLCTSFRNAYNFSFSHAKHIDACLACSAGVFVLEVFLRSLGKSSCSSVEADENPTNTPIIISASCRMNSNGPFTLAILAAI